MTLQVLFRKGGIKEPTFKPQAQRFFLFPTSFHTEGSLLQPGMAEKYAQVLHGGGTASSHCQQDGALHAPVSYTAATARGQTRMCAAMQAITLALTIQLSNSLL